LRVLAMSSVEPELDDPPEGAPTPRKVSSVILRAWIDGLGIPDRDRHAMLDQLGIEPAILERWDLLVDEEVELTLVRWAVERFGPGAGLEAGSGLQRGALSVLEYLMRSADDFGNALQFMIRYQHLIGTPPTFARHANDGVHIALARPYDETSPIEVAIAEFFLTALVVAARDATEPAWTPMRVAFRHAPAASEERYCEALRGSLAFEASESAVVIDRDVLHRPMRGADPRLHRLLIDCMKSVLGPRALGGRIADEVHAVVLELLPTGRLAVGSVAGQLGLTARTLQDRLKDEGTSYTELLESARRDLAHRYLREDPLSVPDIALLLGYSEASAFHRAFKRWTGLTPRQYRSRRLP
jgi:AraC-like DNA-binding protein